MTLRTVISAALVLVTAGVVAGCTPLPQPTGSTTAPSVTPTESAAPSASTSPFPTPSPTLNANQQAAVAAVDGLSDTTARLGGTPSQFTRAQMVTALKRYAGGKVPDASANSFMRLREKGWRYEGHVSITSMMASKVSDNRTALRSEVIVTTCRDQSQLRVVDKSGAVVAKEQANIPAFLLRQYTVFKPDGAKSWKVYGFDIAKGECR